MGAGADRPAQRGGLCCSGRVALGLGPPRWTSRYLGTHRTPGSPFSLTTEASACHGKSWKLSSRVRRGMTSDLSLSAFDLIWCPQISFPARVCVSDQLSGRISIGRSHFLLTPGCLLLTGRLRLLALRGEFVLFHESPCVSVRFSCMINNTHLLFLHIDLWGSEGGSVSDYGSPWDSLLWYQKEHALLIADG